MQFGQTQFGSLPDVTKNLLIINVIFFLGKILDIGIDFDKLFSLHQFQSENFMPHQLITHMFMHADFTHLLFNMFALFMFGKVLESVWGPKRFLTYYILTGLGAALIYIGYMQYQIHSFSNTIDSDQLKMFMKVINTEGADIIHNGQNYTNPILGKLNGLINGPMMGASGAVYGLLLAFGMLFPNTELYLMFIPIPIKAKYLVMGLAALALFGGINNHPGDNIAHFAHLGGMIFGLILLKIWRKNRNTFY